LLFKEREKKERKIKNANRNHRSIKRRDRTITNQTSQTRTWYLASSAVDAAAKFLCKNKEYFGSVFHSFLSDAFKFALPF